MCVAPARVHADVVVARGRQRAAVKRHHVRPDLVHVRGVGEVHHVRGVAAGRAHVDLEAHVVALLAKARLVVGEPEELHVDEATPKAKAPGGGAAQLPQDGVDRGKRAVPEVEPLRRDPGHRGRELLHVLEQRLAVRVQNGVVAKDLALHVLFQHVRRLALLAQQALQVRAAVDPGDAARAHAALRLCERRPAYAGLALHEVERRLQRGQAYLPRGRDAGAVVAQLHVRLALERADLLRVGAGRDVEVRAQRRVLRKPVLVVRLYPVDLAVLVREERDRFEHAGVILEARDPVVLRERILQAAVELVVRGVADAEHVDAAPAQPVAELPVRVGKLRRYEDEVQGAPIRRVRRRAWRVPAMIPTQDCVRVKRDAPRRKAGENCVDNEKTPRSVV